MALTVNLDSQIVVQTAAAWAADATVYSAKRILVTSDVTYTGTDQRKFKIANGVDTWANLDYIPFVLGNGTSNQIAYWSASDTLAALTTATYPSLTELSYVKGVTSNLQSQIKGYTLFFGATNTNPADSTTYFIGGHYATTLITTISNCLKINVPKAGIIKSIKLSMIQSAGTNENSTIYCRINDTSDTIISNSVINNTVNTDISNDSLSINLNAGDFIHIKWVTPTWATNPTGLRIYGVIYIE